MTEPAEQKLRRAGAAVAMATLLLATLTYRVVAARQAHRTEVRELQEQATTQDDREYAEYIASFFFGCSALHIVFELCEPPEREAWAEWERARREREERIATERMERQRLETPSELGDHFPNHMQGEWEPVWPTQAVSAPGVSRRREPGTDDPLVGLDSL